MQADVSIIGGSGALGFGLAVRLGAAGVSIYVGSRDAERAREVVDRARRLVPSGSFQAMVNESAAKAAPMVVLAIPFANQALMLRAIREHMMAGQILVDTTVPLAVAVGGRASRTLGVPQGSAAQQAAELAATGVAVIAALHTVSGAVLGKVSQPLAEDVLVCGDSSEAKQRVANLLQRVPGLRCVDAGRLEMASAAERITALLVGINARYRVHAGIKIVGLPAETLGKRLAEDHVGPSASVDIVPPNG